MISDLVHGLKPPELRKCDGGCGTVVFRHGTFMGRRSEAYGQIALPNTLHVRWSLTQYPLQLSGAPTDTFYCPTCAMVVRDILSTLPRRSS